MAGNSKLFQRRKAKKNYSRLDRWRNSNQRILIVTEGSKTEKNYFEKLKVFLKLPSVEIISNCGSAPINVVDHAIKIANEDSNYNSIFCVFDKDCHSTYCQAIQKIDGLPKSKKFKAITSIPCFEIWFLFHFSNSTRPYIRSGRSGNKSACDNVISDLKNKLGVTNYEKGNEDHFETLRPLLNTAKQNATNVLCQTKAAGTDNPSTLVHELVEHLENSKN